ncbi:MAG: phosphate ABC transporter ATP-binding protein, partial [Thermoflexus sp.]
MEEIILETEDLTVYYDSRPAIEGIRLKIPRRRITAIIGPSGCGKSTLLRCFNRMNDLIPSARVSGKVLFEGVDIYGANVDVVEIRRRIGMVFQKPNPFPKSIYENVAFGPRIQGIRDRRKLDEIVE